MRSGLEAQLLVDYPGEFRLEADLSIAPGETVALLGPNGAGKSTVVATLSGLIPLDGGAIRLGDRTLADTAAGINVAPEHRNIGVVFQDYVLFPHLSVEDNVAFGLVARGMAKQRARARARTVLDALDLADFLERRPEDLSGGQAQRVALARALITDPDLLLLDEPLAALDVASRANLRHTLADHLGRFVGPRLLITHDPTEAFLLADSVCVIEDGTITQAGTPDDIRLRPRTAYAADLAGSNLVSGYARSGTIDVDSHRLATADTHASGPVVATIHPRAISLHRREPEGSPRNTWQTAIDRIEHYGDRVRVRLGEPLQLTAEVTPRAVAALELAVNQPIWISIKATEVTVTSD